MDELFGKSLIRNWSEQAAKWTPGARQKFLTGTLLFVLGVLLQSAQNLAVSPPFAYARGAASLLMSVGLAVQIWGLVVHYHDSVDLNERVRTPDKRN